MTVSSAVRSYSAVSKLIHWLTVLLMAAAFIIIWSVDDDAPNKLQLITLHKSLGVTIWALVVLRLIWRHIAGVPSLPVDMPDWQKLAARLAQWTLYLMLFFQPIGGYLGSSLFGYPTPWFGIFVIPPAVAQNKELAKQVFEIHETAGLLMLVVIGLHAVGALYHHYVRRDDVLRSMLPGAKV